MRTKTELLLRPGLEDYYGHIQESLSLEVSSPSFLQSSRRDVELASCDRGLMLSLNGVVANRSPAPTGIGAHRNIPKASREIINKSRCGQRTLLMSLSGPRRNAADGGTTNARGEKKRKGFS